MARDPRSETLGLTPSQTVGPFFHVGLGWLLGDKIADAGVSGRHISVRGRVFDGNGTPVPDALIEAWHADASGTYARRSETHGKPPSPVFHGFVRLATNDAGEFRFATVKPGRVAAPGSGLQAPHVAVNIFMRGLLRQLVTRIYFADEFSNQDDLVLQSVAESRRKTLIAELLPGTADAFEWNVVLQGEAETVFFDG